MRDAGKFLTGLVCTIAGLILFFNQVSISGFSLFSYGRVPLGGIFILLLAAAFILYIVKPNVFSKAFLIASLVAFVIAIILSVEIYVRHMSALLMLGILALVCFGVAMIIKSTLIAKK